MPDQYVRVASLNEIPEGRSKLVNVDGDDIAVWRIGGKCYAINNVCPHQHFSKLNEGTLDGLYLTCPMHGWTFNLEDGRPKTGSGLAKVYRVRIENGEVLVGAQL